MLDEIIEVQPPQTEVKQVKSLVKNCLSAMKKAKQRLEKENIWFEQKGVVDFVKSESEILRLLEDFYDSYEKMQAVQGLNQIIGESEYALVEKEHETFLEVIKKYHINVKIASKVGEIFMNSAKNSINKTAKMDSGYSKEGIMISDKKVLENMPAVAFNSKV